MRRSAWCCSPISWRGLWITDMRFRMVFSAYGVLDLVVIISMMAPIVGEGLAFLRVARVFRLLRPIHAAPAAGSAGSATTRTSSSSAMNLVIFYL